MHLLACSWYYCAQLIAKPKAACALHFSWAATSSNLGLSANMTSSIKRDYIMYHYVIRRPSHSHRYKQQQPFNGRLSGTTRVGRYQKKRSPAHTHPVSHHIQHYCFRHAHSCLQRKPPFNFGVYSLPNEIPHSKNTPSPHQVSLSEEHIP